eukprot:GHVS01038389.1.p1 GENE.GHVS01038389.1~~GHVS01038389.1.p1  ORF type:complete len:161 (+),score=8.54 GHVS01038389.1:77-559(+)
MAIPLLRIGLAVLFFAFCKVAESKKWKAISFKELFSTITDCHTDTADDTFDNLLSVTCLQNNSALNEKTARLDHDQSLIGYDFVAAVITADGNKGLIIHGTNGASVELREGQLFKESLCELAYCPMDRGGFIRITYKNGHGDERIVVRVEELLVTPQFLN